METFSIENLTFSYPNMDAPVLSNINLNVKSGDFFVIFGHSGSGKSTLLRQLKPSICPHGKKSGSIYFCGNDINVLSERDAAAQIGFVLQSPESQIVTDKVWHELAFGLESLGYDSITIRRRCAEMAAFFGIEDWYDKKVCELSGGQKQLLCLASVMTMQPKVLILDEPTAQLDPIAASDFLSTLAKINRELGITVILSEHRLEEALPLADTVAVMQNGKIICCDSVNEVGNYLKDNNSNMFSAMPTAMRIWGSVDNDLDCPVTVNEGRAFISEYMKNREMNSFVDTSDKEETNDALITADEVFFRYEKELPDTVSNLSFSACSGELFCILGGNGSGKTTMLKLLSGIKKPYAGQIVAKGKVALLPQNPQTLFVKKTVKENLEYVLLSKGTDRKNIEDEIKSVAELCDITPLLSRHPYDLSGGEQQRSALAQILLLSPEILLLDEPTKGMDVPFKEKLAQILQKLKNSGKCIVMVSHDIEFCAQYADKCGLFFGGSIVTASTPNEFFAGNSFYTTAANRIIREKEPKAVTVSQVISLIGGNAPQLNRTDEKAVEFSVPQVKKVTQTPLPLWRKICAVISILMSVGLLVYTAANENLAKMITNDGVTSLGKNQLILYGIIILFMFLTAVFLGKGKSVNKNIQTPTKKRKLSKRTRLATFITVIFIPITLFACVYYFDYKQYYLTALAVLIECMLPFFFAFEGRRPKAREIVIIATFCALAIAGRAAFFMIPQFKPVLAITVIAGVAFGSEAGFFVGAVSMLVSNIMFSQGPWTPWQMFAMGIIGFLAGLLYKKGLLRRTRISLCAFGALSAIIIYGGIMNPAAALIWGGESMNWKIIITYYFTGFPLDVVHAVATVIFIWFGAEPMFEKTDRIKTKYGIMD